MTKVEGVPMATVGDATFFSRLEKRIWTEINIILGDRPSDTDFANGGGFLRHKTVNVMKAWRALMELLGLRHALPDDVFGTSKRSFIGIPFVMRSSIGRYLDDADSPYYSLYMRFVCMDDMSKTMTMREWGQRYFALNPDQGKQVCWNEGRVVEAREAKPVKRQLRLRGQLGDRKVEA